MTALNHATRRRLQSLPQIPSVWEGDRHPLAPGMNSSSEWVGIEPTSDTGECILWVDGSQGMVRAMDVVTPEVGPEAVVRVLLRAMQQPHSPAKPARPQKIVVRDRELQFFLRGVLQDLGITIEYVPELPLIDEIFQSFQDVVNSRIPQLPPRYASLLEEKAAELWEVAPWDILGDHQILSIEVNRWDINKVYACVMGMLGMEYGVLFYRSLDSLRRFREQVLTNDSMEQLEEAFLGQDCLFLTFEQGESPLPGEELEEFEDLPLNGEVHSVFGNLHPLEGPRSFLYDEEALLLLVSLEAMQRFFRQHQAKLAGFPALSSRYRIPLPDEAEGQQIMVRVETLPDLAAELLEMSPLDESELLKTPSLRDDLVPRDSFLSLGVIPWEVLELVRQSAEHYQSGEATVEGDGLPVVMIQTSRPKAKALIYDLQTSGGLQAICFNPGHDPNSGDRYDLGLFQTGNGTLALFGEFLETDPVHIAARKKWEQRCRKTGGYCGLIIAKGLKGAARGNPQFKDMVGLFEAKALSSDDLGLGTLVLQLKVDWT